MRRLLSCLLGLGFAAHAPVHAAVIRAQATPVRVMVSDASPMSVTVTWTITRAPGTMREPLTMTVGSRGAEIVIDGAVIAQVGPVLSQVSTLGPNRQDVLLFTETVMLDRDVAVAVARATRASLRRTFTDSYGFASGEVALIPQTGLAAAFAITRMELRFADASRTKLVRQGEGVEVDAVVNFSGTGVGRFAWELAGPVPAGAVPIYRTLEQMNAPLATGGRKVMHSPALPSDRAGAYFVRLRPLDSANRLEPPIIRYFVITSRAMATSEEMHEMHATRPTADTRIAPGTVFEWQPVPGAAAYRVELYSNREPALVSAARPVAGAVVSGDQTSLKLGIITMAKFTQGETLFWKVTAFDAHGVAIGASKPRRAAAGESRAR